MNLRSTEGLENTGYSSLWKREVRRDFYDHEIIKKISPIPWLSKRGIFGTIISVNGKISHMLE
jgi:hypothetical protein